MPTLEDEGLRHLKCHLLTDPELQDDQRLSFPPAPLPRTILRLPDVQWM